MNTIVKNLDTATTVPVAGHVVQLTLPHRENQIRLGVGQDSDRDEIHRKNVDRRIM